MDTIKNLEGTEAIEKIKELARDLCLFCTYENDNIVSRPLSTQAIEDDGTIWFFSRRDSEKNQQVKQDDRVTLMYMDHGKQHYLSLSGTAEVLKDRQKTEELWDKIEEAWFPEGKDDPSLTLIRFTPETGHYWDTKSGKLVSMLHIAMSLVTGRENNNSIEGDLNLK